MAIADDFTIDYSAKTVTHTAGTTVYTANALYSWLMDVFDELDQLDDSVPMSAQTPTEYTLINGWTMPDASFYFLKSGAVKTEDNNNLWANVYTLGTIASGTSIYIVQNGAKITSWWSTGHIDVLVKVKASGALIDSGNLTLFARELGDLYDHFPIDVSSGGRNAVPLATSADLNDSEGGSAYSDITITFGSVNKDLDNGDGANPYDVVIDCASRPLSEVYERLKYVTRRGETANQNGVDGEQYISANASYSPVKASPFGTFAGGTFFGARGVWIEDYDADDAKSFQLIDSNGDTQSPPNVVPVKVTSVAVGDRVAVFVLTGTGGTINKAQYAATLAGNNSGDGTIVVKTAIGADTPAAGAVRIGSDRYAYTSWATSTFTLSGTLTTNYAEDTGVYVPLIDEQAAATTSQTTIKYSANIPVLVRVRKKGIQPFEVESAVTNVGLSVSAIRTVDGIVS